MLLASEQVPPALMVAGVLPGRVLLCTITKPTTFAGDGAASCTPLIIDDAPTQQFTLPP